MSRKRIKRIASLIMPDESVADVGCDHGYLALELLNQGHKGKIVCSDNKPGPLANARRNLDENGYRDVETVLADGVSGFEQTYDVTVMAGMGYHTVIAILETNPAYFAQGKIIIQVNAEVPAMRRYLTENGFAIINEQVVKDYKYYEIIVAVKGQQQLTEDETEFGPCLLKERPDEFLDYQQYRLEKIRDILKKLPQGHPDEEKLINKMKRIREVINP